MNVLVDFFPFILQIYAVSITIRIVVSFYIRFHK